MPRSVEYIFKRDISLLDKVFASVGNFILENKIEKNMAFAIEVAVEEIFTNLVKYNASARSDITINLRKENNTLFISFIDDQAVPFDITTSSKPDTECRVQERRIGGLGLHLVRQVMDNVSYQYKDGKSIITLSKLIGKPNV